MSRSDLNMTTNEGVTELQDNTVHELTVKPHTHTQTLSHTLTYSRSHSHTNTQTHTHTYTHTHTHTYTHTNSHTHTHTHTETHTHIYSQKLMCVTLEWTSFVLMFELPCWSYVMCVHRLDVKKSDLTARFIWIHFTMPFWPFWIF